MHALLLLSIAQHTKFVLPSFTDSTDTIGGQNSKNASHHRGSAR